MNNRVLDTLTHKCGVNKDEKIIVALSGGADSVTLLDVLLSISESGFPLLICAAHVNHNLRGEESQRDEEFVRNLCNDAGVELFVLSENVAKLAESRKESIELCARNVRYDFFRRLSIENNAKIATAHTLSDCEETMLYNIARGTTLHGLTSIPYIRGEIVRPLLDVTREQVENYCREKGLSYVQDSTNADETVCKRNKIRHSVLPPLKSINDGFDRNFLRLREDLMLSDDFLRESAKKAMADSRNDFGYSAQKLTKLHPALLRYTIALIISEAGGSAENRHILLCERMLTQPSAVMLPEGFTAVCNQGTFRVVKSFSDSEFSELTFDEGVNFSYNGKIYTAVKVDADSNVYKKFASSCIACDKINSNTVIRKRREGDTFSPLGRGITKPLRKLQNELKIPKEKRADTLVVANGSTVLWAEYIGVSAYGEVSGTSLVGIYIEINEEG